MSKISRFYIATFVAIAFLASLQSLTLPLVSNVFSSNMVLQRAPLRARVWGWSTAGSSVNLTLNGPNPSVHYTTAGSDGKWLITLDQTPAGGPYNLTVQSEAKSVVFQNVMFGDVLLCSGQSNMWNGLASINNGTDEAFKYANFTNIRILPVPLIDPPTPYNRFVPNLVINATGFSGWRTPSNSFLKDFSALCWLTGRHLSESLNNAVPIGLIHNAWYGRNIESFMSPYVANNTECFASSYQNATIYNTMVYPLFPMQFIAMIWYQGEANAGMTSYGCFLGRMITDYRQSFENDFLFVPIQLAPINTTNPWAVTREQQRLGGIRAGHSCTVSNIDLGDTVRIDDLHPHTKAPLGWRAHLCIRKFCYNEPELIFSGPLPKCSVANTTSNTLTISFYRGTVGSGLHLKTAQCPSPLASICGSAWEIYNGTKWYPATYKLSEDRQDLILSDVTLTNVSKISYRNGYAGWPLSVLYNSDDLPPPNYVMSYQPDCSVDEIYQPDVIPAPDMEPTSDSPASSGPSVDLKVPVTSGSAVVYVAMALLVLLYVFLLV